MDKVVTALEVTVISFWRCVGSQATNKGGWALAANVQAECETSSPTIIKNFDQFPGEQELFERSKDIQRNFIR